MRVLAALAFCAALPLAPLHGFPRELQPLADEFMAADRESNFLVWRGFDEYIPKALTLEEAQLIGGMFGKIQAGSYGDTTTTIQAFAKKYGKLVGIPEGVDPLKGFRKFREFEHANGKWIQYAPTKGGLDDISALMTYAFKDSGMLCAVVGRWRPVPGDVPAGIGRKAALQRAQDEIKRQIRYAEISARGAVRYTESLVTDPENDRKVVRLIGVTVDVGHPARPKRVLMTGDGTVLLAEDAAYRASGSVFANDPESDGERVVSRDLPDLLPPVGKAGSYVIKGRHVRPDPGFADNRASSTDGSFAPAPFDPDPSQPFAEVSVYHYLTRGLAKAREGGLTDAELKPFLPLYYDHWAIPACEHLEPDEKDTRPDVIARKTEDAKGCAAFQRDNAWFNPATMRLNFSAMNRNATRKKAGVETMKHPAYEATIVVHELGHWVHHILSPHHALGGVPNANLEAAASAEGLADLFAALTCDDPVIGNYFLGAEKRDLSRMVRYREVLPISHDAKTTGVGRRPHEAGLAFASAFWRMKPELGEANALRVLIASMRACHLPARFKHLALATLAMDQLLSPVPRGRKMAEAYRLHGLLDGFFPAP